MRLDVTGASDATTPVALLKTSATKTGLFKKAPTAIFLNAYKILLFKLTQIATSAAKECFCSTACSINVRPVQKVCIQTTKKPDIRMSGLAC